MNIRICTKASVSLAQLFREKHLKGRLSKKSAFVIITITISGFCTALCFLFFFWGGVEALGLGGPMGS